MNASPSAVLEPSMTTRSEKGLRRLCVCVCGKGEIVTHERDRNLWDIDMLN